MKKVWNAVCDCRVSGFRASWRQWLEVCGLGTPSPKTLCDVSFLENKSFRKWVKMVVEIILYKPREKYLAIPILVEKCCTYVCHTHV